MALKQFLSNKLGHIIYPKTQTDCVFLDKNNSITLESELTTLWNVVVTDRNRFGFGVDRVNFSTNEAKTVLYVDVYSGNSSQHIRLTCNSSNGSVTCSRIN